MAVFLPPIKAVLKGDNAAYFLRYAQNQLTILERQMSFQGLNEGRRVISPHDGVTVECLSKFGNKEIRIHVQSTPVVSIKRDNNLSTKPTKRVYRETKKEIQCVLVAFTSCQYNTVVPLFNRVTAWGLIPDYESTDTVTIQGDNILFPAIPTLILDVDVLSNEVFFPMCTVDDTEWDAALSKAMLYLNSFEDTENHVQTASGEMLHPDNQVDECNGSITVLTNANYADVSALGYSYYASGYYWSTPVDGYSIPVYHQLDCYDKLFLYNTANWINLDNAATAVGKFYGYYPDFGTWDTSFRDAGVHLGPLSTDAWYQYGGRKTTAGQVFIKGQYYLFPAYEFLSTLFISATLTTSDDSNININFGWPTGFYDLGVEEISGDAGGIQQITKSATHAPQVNTPFGVINPEDYLKYVGEGTFDQVIKPSYFIDVVVDMGYEEIPPVVCGISLKNGYWRDQDYCSGISTPWFISSASVLRSGIVSEITQELEIGVKKTILQENPVIALSSCNSSSITRTRSYYFAPGDTDSTITSGILYGVTMQVVFPTWLWTGDDATESWKPYDSYLLGNLFRLTEVEEAINTILAPAVASIVANVIPTNRLSLASYGIDFKTKLFI